MDSCHSKPIKSIFEKQNPQYNQKIRTITAELFQMLSPWYRVMHYITNVSLQNTNHFNKHLKSIQ